MSDFVTTMLTADTFTGLVHVTLAVMCLILGPFIFLRRKGDARHKFLGRIWAIMMLIVNVSALVTYDINGKPNMFHIFAVINLIALVPGFIFIRLYQKSRKPLHLVMHRKLMVWAYFGLASAGVWQVATTFIRLSLTDINLGSMFIALGVLTFVCTGFVHFYLERTEKKI